MTALLEKAVAELSQLPDTEQDALARRLLDELEDERQWAASFATSQDMLAQMAAVAGRNSTVREMRFLKDFLR